MSTGLKWEWNASLAIAPHAAPHRNPLHVLAILTPCGAGGSLFVLRCVTRARFPAFSGAWQWRQFWRRAGRWWLSKMLRPLRPLRVKRGVNVLPLLGHEAERKSLQLRNLSRMPSWLRIVLFEHMACDKNTAHGALEKSLVFLCWRWVQYGFHSSSVDQLVYVRHAIIFATCSETESLKTLWGCGYELFGLTFDFQYISTSVLFLILNLFHVKANICVISVFWILPTRLPIQCIAIVCLCLVWVLWP